MITNNNGAVIQEKLSERAVSNLSGYESLMNTVMDYSRLLTTDGNSVKIPKMGAKTATQTKAEDGSFTLQTQNASPITIDVTKRAGDAFYISDELSQAEKINMVSLRSEQIVDSLKDYVNADIISVVTANADIVTIGDGTTDITTAFVANAAEALDEAGAPKSDRFLVVSTKQFYKLKLLNEFVIKDFVTVAGTNATNQIVGDLLGFTVIQQPTSVIGQNNIYFHMSAVGFASNKRVNVESDRDLLKKQTNFVIDMVYGLESINPEYSGTINTL